MGPSSPSNLLRTLNAPSLCLSWPGSPLPHWGLGQGKSSGAPPGWRRGASPPLHLAPSRPRDSSRHPHPGRPAAGSGEGEGAPGRRAAHLLQQELGTPRSGAGEPAFRGQGPGMGARAWRPLPPTPLSSLGSEAHPGTPGSGGSFPSGARGLLCPWRGRVSSAPLPRSASRYSPSPAGHGPAARRDRLLSVAAQRPPPPPPSPPPPRAPAPLGGRPAGSRPPSLF